MGGYAETGQGIAIMINANDNSGMMRRIYEFVAREYLGLPLSVKIVPRVCA